MDFPNSPTVGQRWPFAGRTWIWTGTGWRATTSGGQALAAFTGIDPIWFSVSAIPAPVGYPNFVLLNFI